MKEIIYKGGALKMKDTKNLVAAERRFFGEVRRVINLAEMAVMNLTGKKAPSTPENWEKVDLGPKFGNLKEKTIFISGGSRGIGLEIAKRCARDGAHVVIAAKTSEPHPKLPGTIHTACDEINKAGEKDWPC